MRLLAVFFIGLLLGLLLFSVYLPFYRKCDSDNCLVKLKYSKQYCHDCEEEKPITWQIPTIAPPY